MIRVRALGGGLAVDGRAEGEGFEPLRALARSRAGTPPVTEDGVIA